jgi:hypothetical protein
MELFEKTEKQHFDDAFMYSIAYAETKVKSLEQLSAFLIHSNKNLRFTNFRTVPAESNRFYHVIKPFEYVVADHERGNIINIELLGFKVKGEEFIRVGPPHYEKIKNSECITYRPGYKLYESPDLKTLLLVHTEKVE